MVDNVEEARANEQAIASEVCAVSLEAAKQMSDALFGELADPGSVLFDVINARTAGLPNDRKLGLVPALLVDPTRSGVVVARYLQQSGELPKEVASQDPDQMVTLWSFEAQKSEIPPLKVPEGKEEAVMAVADKMQMRGGGPVIFERERAGEVPIAPESRIIISGGARNANRERIRSAMAIKEAYPDHIGPLLATVDPRRILEEPELKAVESFASGVKNEQELFVASARAEGWVPHEDNANGSSFLPDGSSYINFVHPETAREMIVFAPVRKFESDGRQKSAVHNVYESLSVHGKEAFGIGIAGEPIVHVTSTHYGPMAVMNNLLAAHELRMSVESFHVVGDNQRTRDAKAHLIEIGKTLDRVDVAIQFPAIKDKLLLEAA